MTNEEFDKRLSGHIKQVFDDTEHAGADEGWFLLREKYPAKADKKPIAWFWWGAAAAILLFGVATGLWLNKNKTVVHNKLSIIKSIPAKANNDSALQRIDKSTDAKILTSDKTKSILNHTASPVGASVNGPLPAIALSKISHKQIIHSTTKNAFTNNNKSVITAFAEKNTPIPSQNIGQPNDHHNTATDTAQTTVNTLTAKATDTTSAKQAVKPVVTVKLPKPDSIKPAVKSTVSKRIIFGVFASAFYNYALHSNTLFNFGGGGTVDINLIGGFKLATGIGVIRNDLYYTSPPGSEGRTALSSVVVVTTTTVAFKNYQANLLALDVPLNLKYQFGTSYNFISAGLSSQTYIRQSYTQVNTYTSYTTSTSSSLTVVSSTDVPTSKEYGIGHLDVAKTLNLSFGLGYRLSSKSILVFEPFLKTPLSGLGSQNLKYGSYGLNLKISFERKP